MLDDSLLLNVVLIDCQCDVHGVIVPIVSFQNQLCVGSTQAKDTDREVAAHVTQQHVSCRSAGVIQIVYELAERLHSDCLIV